jgi:erythronate-4-phosphate dehydrogenase
MKIAADIDIPFLKGLPEQFANEVDYFSSAEFSRKRIADADALIVRTVDKCTQETLAGTRVKFIASASAGFDHIDAAYCREHQIAWTSVPGANAGSVAQYFLSALMRLSLAHGFALQQKTIGLIGVGYVGKAIEHFCRVLGIRTLLNDPPRAEKEGDGAFVSLETLQKECDIISIHTPLTHEGDYKTYHLADRPFFEALERQPLFINAARGEVVDTGALKAALKAGRVSRTVMDCWEGEPAVDRELLEMVDIPTPHIAGFSADGKANATRRTLEAVKQFFHIPASGEAMSSEAIVLPPPAHPVIDLNVFDASKRIEGAVLHTLHTGDVERAFRASPREFEYLRTHYANPREFSAYTVLNAASAEQELLQRLDRKSVV